MKKTASTSPTRSKTISRRQFVGNTAAAAAAFSVLPRQILGRGANSPPSGKITLAAIGIGDQGRRDLQRFLDRPEVRVVAVCDVDANLRNAARDRVNQTYKSKDCAVYTDYRELLAGGKDIDAVLVVTPDHTHAVISIAAMKQGKHVYCQKPMTLTVHEARQMAKVARQYQVATQLGTANQAREDRRVLQEWIEDGVIGGVREVHIWSNRPLWPQGIDRPTETPPVPATLDWDLWLGPAPHRPYHPAYLPLLFRGWWDFGAGALGDMGCYAFDTIFRVLDLNAPATIEGSGSGFARRLWDRPRLNPETYPQASLITWQFPARGQKPPVTLTWYDGGLRPPRPRELEKDRPLKEEGMILMGENGTILADFAGRNPRLVPESKMAAYQPPPPRLARSIGHFEEWLAACRGGEPAGANFEFSALVTEALLLGNVALRSGQHLIWDSAKFAIENAPQTNPFLHYNYRQGWTL